MAATRPSPDPEQVVIDDVDALKALADPRRMSLLLAAADEAMTVKELAGLLDVPPTRLYYHVKMLVSHGLMRVAKRRMVSGIEERSYQATAKSWTLSAPLLSSALVRTGVIKALLDMTAAELGLALGRDEVLIGEPNSSVPVLVFTKWMLDPDAAAEVQRRLESMMEEFGSLRARDGESEYHALLTVYRHS
jgi:DNA-binding transcriptional ArsR family regulator